MRVLWSKGEYRVGTRANEARSFPLEFGSHRLRYHYFLLVVELKKIVYFVIGVAVVVETVVK